MAAISTHRCPSCGVLNASNQAFCQQCLGPLLAERPHAPVQPMTGETSHLYHDRTGHAMLLFSRGDIEYATAGLALTTAWNNVATLVRTNQGVCLRLFQTPQHVTLSLSNGHMWSTDGTRSIPLEPFGYPHNDSLAHDLWCYAPQLHRFMAHPATR